MPRGRGNRRLSTDGHGRAALAACRNMLTRTARRVLSADRQLGYRATAVVGDPDAIAVDGNRIRVGEVVAARWQGPRPAAVAAGHHGHRPARLRVRGVGHPDVGAIDGDRVWPIEAVAAT